MSYHFVPEPGVPFDHRSRRNSEPVVRHRDNELSDHPGPYRTGFVGVQTEFFSPQPSRERIYSHRGCPPLDPNSRSDSPVDTILTPTSTLDAHDHLNLEHLDRLILLHPERVAAPPAFQLFNMSSTFSINQKPPFHDPMAGLGTQAYEVIKIKNVPYAVTIDEIKSLVNRLTPSPLIRKHEQGFPVHIVMERATGKTMEVYVEFQNQGAARAAVNRAERQAMDGRTLKMGTRHVTVELSNEGELCAAVFPRAKSVRWDLKNGVPTILSNQDPDFSGGFQGFLTMEEITSVRKHSADPQKSTFSQRCPQRVYESMMSTLYKFPWHVPMGYTVNDRNFLWSVFMDMLNNLLNKVQPSGDPTLGGSPTREVGLGHGLLMDFLFAGLNVPMFSLRQKFMIVYAAGSVGLGMPIQQQAAKWPFQALIPSPNTPSKVIDEWLEVLEVGFAEMITHNLSHKYQAYVDLSRDESGNMQLELNDVGRQLTFFGLLRLELGLMEIIVEHGREAWCAGWGIAYQPLDMYGPEFPYCYPYDNMQAKIDAETRSRATHRNERSESAERRQLTRNYVQGRIGSQSSTDVTQVSDESEPVVRRIANEAFNDISFGSRRTALGITTDSVAIAANSDAEAFRRAIATVDRSDDEETFRDVGSASRQSTSGSTFNPASPAFVPGRSFVPGRPFVPDRSVVPDRSFVQGRSFASDRSSPGRLRTPSEPRAIGNGHTFVPIPTWAANRITPPRQRNMLPHSKSAGQLAQGTQGGDARPYDPFSSDVSPQSRRSSFARPGARSTSSSPGNTRTMSQASVGSGAGNEQKLTSSNIHSSQASYNQWAAGLAAAPPPSPATVGEAAHRRTEVATRFTVNMSGSPARGFGSGANTPVHNNAMNDLAAGFPTMSLGSANAQTPTYGTAIAGRDNIWSSGSPARIRRAASSTGHHTVRVQATIDEESDMHATHNTDGGEDSGNEAGGVNI